MDLVFQRKALMLIYQLLDRKVPNKPCIPFMPQKTVYGKSPVSAPLPRTTPEKQGVSSEYLAAFFRELKESDEVFPHTAMVIRNGNVIGECSYAPYSTEYLHVTHSLCKSITGLAIGMLCDDGLLSLEDQVGKIFEKRISPIAIIRPRATVENLLTMSSGAVFNEAGSITESDWVQAFCESAARFAPGTAFNYNSMNTFMLSAIVRELTGKTLEDFLRPRLFEPLGISDFFWEKAPDGNNKGGWGLYAHLEDLAKIALLLENNGIWDGKRLISENWIQKATTAQITATSGVGDYDYGYQTWVGRKGTTAQGSFLFNGMLGQNIICFPEKKLIIAANAGNGSMFQQNEFFTIVNRYFGGAYSPAGALPDSYDEYATLCSTVSSYSEQTPTIEKKRIRDRLKSVVHYFRKSEKKPALPEKCDLFTGKTYTFSPDYASSVSVVPLMLQTVQNSFTEGLTSIDFSVDNDVFLITFTEGAEKITVTPGFGSWNEGVINLNGENYSIASTAAFATDEDDRLVLKLDIAFTETAHVRKIKIYPSKGKAAFRFTETPGVDCVLGCMEATIGELKINKLIDRLASRADADYIIYRLKKVFEPEFRGTEK